MDELHPHIPPTKWSAVDRTRIRLLALALVFDASLSAHVVCRRRDALGNEWHRPLGGAIEVGELSVDAVVREVREELGAVLLEPVELGVLEDIYRLDGRTAHEVSWIFVGSVEPSFLPRPEGRYFDDAGVTGWMEWRATSGQSLPLRPPGLQRLIDAWLAGKHP